MWKKVNLKSITEKTFQWKPTKEPRDSFYYIDVSSVSNETFSIKKLQKINATSAPGRARKIVKWEDTIYATIRPSLKRIAYISNEYDDQIASTAFCVIRPDRNKAFPLYIYYSLLSDSINSKIIELQHGASYPAVTDKDILNQSVHLPSLKEQEKIAAILLKIQQAIEVQESIIEAVQELKKSTMQYVFTYGLRVEKTKDTEIGRIPESWEIKRLGKFANVVTKGSSPTWQGFEYCEYGILFIRSQNVGNGMLLLNDLVHLPTSFNLKEKRSIIHTGDLLINLVGASIGRAAIADERINGSNTNQAVAIVRLNEGQLTNWYTMYFLLTDKGQEVINFNKKDIARANISLTDIKNFLIPVPTINEQKKIADILQKIDRKIELHTSKRTTLQDLFKTMLNKLMTVEVRVNNLDINVSEVVKERP